MVTEESVQEQLKAIGFQQFGWGKKEVRELPHILLPDEQIFECVNGLYEGGFALLVATDVRVLLVDKKPLNFLTVEDVRFDMINEIDYSHRLFGANINITSGGDKNMRFRSYDQKRLRKLITHVQHSMADGKKKQHSHQEGQNQHLEKINQQLQAYLMAQHQHQQELHAHLKVQGASPAVIQPEPVKPSPELSDYLFAQSLLNQYQQQAGPLPLDVVDDTSNDTSAPSMPSTPLLPPLAASSLPVPPLPVQQPTVLPALQPDPELDPEPSYSRSQLEEEMYNAGIREIYGSRIAAAARQGFDANPLKIAYAKLPSVLRGRRFNRIRPPFIHPPGSGETEPKAV